MSALTFNPAPGVYGKIRDLGANARNQPTSYAGTIGMAEKGPVGVPVMCTGYDQFKAVFGKRHPTYGYAGYLAEHYLEESILYFMRIVNNAFTASAFWTVDNPSASTPVFQIVNNTESGQVTGMLSPESYGFLPTQAGIQSIPGLFYAANPGFWNNRISIRVRTSCPDGINPVVGRDRGIYNAKVFIVEVFYDYDRNPGPVEQFRCTRTPFVDELGNQLFIEQVLQQSEYIRFRNNPHAPEFDVLSGAQEFLDGGTDGERVTNDQVIEAWDKYSDPEEYQVQILVQCGLGDHLVQRKILDVCANRQDADAILDAPSNQQSAADVVNYRRDILNKNSIDGCMMTPDVLVFDKENGIKVWLPPSCVCAPIYPLTDRTRGVHFAPAGVERGALRILKLAHVYDELSREALDQAQLNYIRDLPQYGPTLFNQSTLYNRDSPLQYTNVVRLVKNLLKTMSVEANYYLFDPNNSLLRAKVRQVAFDACKRSKDAGGLYGFSVICDERNNTNATIASGDLILDMILDPTIAAKQLHFTFAINRKGSRVTTL